PDRSAIFDAHDEVIAGNVIAYGATSGELFVNGGVGQRFCVRNSGVTAVVETVGDHGCEYMTGGRVVVLGTIGRNFAAGMSGGIPFVRDELGECASSGNLQMVGLEKLEDAAEIDGLRRMIENHLHHTSSERAKQVLADWGVLVLGFVKVIPKDYKRMLAAIARAHEQGLAGEEAIMVAFDENAHDL